MTQHQVYGQEVPQEVIDDLLEEGIEEEEITDEFLETLFYYEYQDNR